MIKGTIKQTLVLPLTFKGDGVLPLNDKPMILERLICSSSSPCFLYIREQQGSLSQQVMDRLLRREKLILASFSIDGEQTYYLMINQYIPLRTPCEMEVKFKEGSGFLQASLQLMEVE